MPVYHDNEKLSKGGLIENPEFGKNIWEGYARVFNKYFDSIDRSLNEIADEIDKNREGAVHKLGKVSDELTQFVKHAKNCIDQYSQARGKLNKAAKSMYGKEGWDILNKLSGFFSKVITKIRSIVAKIKSKNKLRKNPEAMKSIVGLEKITDDTQKLNAQTKELLSDMPKDKKEGHEEHSSEKTHKDSNANVGDKGPRGKVVSGGSSIIQSPASKHEQKKD